MFKGIAASPGVAIGRAVIHRHHELTVQELSIAQEAINEEISKFTWTMERCRGEIQNLKERSRQAIGAEQAAIFDAHLAIVSDPVFSSEVISQIKEKQFTAEAAVSRVMNKYIDILRATDDKYMQERAIDIEDVGKRILHNLLGGPGLSFVNPEEPRVVIAKDLTPSETAQLNPAQVLGLVTVAGGTASHIAIMARAMEIPAVMGISQGLELVNDGDFVIIDGDQGLVMINPSPAFLLEYEHRLDTYQKEKVEWKKGVDLSATTLDGQTMPLMANIGTTQEAKVVLAKGAQGVGLFRTEFVFLAHQIFPGEEEQLEVYRRLIQNLNGKPVAIRTLDVGGDKALPYVSWPAELNPTLGLRGMRWTLKKREILKTQLRAILRASTYGPVSIIYPMINGLEDWYEANKVLQEAKEGLVREGKGFAEDILIGAMIEVPSAALVAEFLAKEVDFFSIGTNDLAQYTLAVDRGNQEVSDLYDPLHPAVLKLLEMVIVAARKENKPVSVCGELAGDPYAAVLLMGMGVSQLSMTPRALYRVKQQIRRVSTNQAKELVEKVKGLSDGRQIAQMLRENLG